MVRKELEDLDKIINKFTPNRQYKIEQWIEIWNNYLIYEDRFKPTMNIKYNKKDIVQISLGYNVGSEQGGKRPAVVMEDNDKKSPVIMVVPLASIDSSKGQKLGKSDVLLGEISDLNAVLNMPKDTESKALVNQMRCISKQRIIRPTKEHHTVTKISDVQFEAITRKIVKLYL